MMTTRGSGVPIVIVIAVALVPAMGVENEKSIGDSKLLQWRNDFLTVSWRSGDFVLRLQNNKVGESISIPIGIGVLDFDAGLVSGFEPETSRPAITRTKQGAIWRFALKTASIPNSERSVRCSVEFAFDSGVPWITKKARFEITGATGELLLKEVVLDEVAFDGRHPRQPFGGWQSYPVLADAFYCGVAFPVADVRVRKEVARLSYRPGRRIATGKPYSTWSAVYGVTTEGDSRRAFETYVESFRPKSAPIHIHYNSWWSAPAPFTERHMLDLIQTLHNECYKPFGVGVDTFCLDMGWSRLKSIWKIDEKNFPRGFSNLTRNLGAMNARLGLWVSPSSMYPGALDTDWAEANGYETIQIPGRKKPGACLAGEKYQSAFKASLLDLIRRYKIAHFKFDGYVHECPEIDHGHEPGALSREKIALGVIDIFKALRAQNPHVWIEATCFGFRPSPWWLAYINSAIGTFGDDAPIGRVPCPVYRESYTTARDFYNLQGTKDVLIPIRGQEVLGVIHQTSEPLQNDAVVTFLRGHSFVPLYVNPQYMNARRWRFLARLCSWARKNATLLTQTTPLCLGAWAEDKSQFDQSDAPRQPYGYAHSNRAGGLLLLRNPWVNPATVNLVLDGSAGFSKTLSDTRPVCLYPEYGKVDRAYSYGDRLTVNLAPYETRLLAFGGYDNAPDLDFKPRGLSASHVAAKVFEAQGKAQLRLEVSGSAPAKQLWMLAEASRAFRMPEVRIDVNNVRICPEVLESAEGWRRSGRRVPEHWIWFVANLPAGKSNVNIEAEVLDDLRLSAWVVSKEKIADDPSPSRPLLPPEERFLHAIQVLSPVELRYPHAEKLINLALASRGAKATASSTWSSKHDASFLIDGDVTTRWNSAAGDKDGSWVQVDLGTAGKIHEVGFLEAAGGRITKYKIQSWNGAGWDDLIVASKRSRKTSVRRRFSPVTTARVRMLVLAADEVPTLYEFGVYGEP